jgi:DNA sulfur modification protein DndB
MIELNETDTANNMVVGDDLAREARRRKSDKEIVKVPKGDPIPDGWSIDKEYKTKLRLARQKSTDLLLGDKLWLLFYNMGMTALSTRDLALEIRTQGGTEIFVPTLIAQDEYIVFVVVAVTQDLPARKKRMHNEIQSLVSNQSSIMSAIKKLIGVPNAKIVFVLATENIEWQNSDRSDANDADILVWDEYDIMGLEELTKIAGNGARYQVYNRIFYGKKIKSFEIRVPALKAKMGGRTYYCMTMTPEHLLKIAYVHQRSASSTFIDISETYQRVLDPKRVREIRAYVDDSGGFFPNSVILNFNHRFKKEEQIGTAKQLGDIAFAEPVMITLPPYFGSAWIIDGQHRIYGYADSKLKGSETIPVVAFVEEIPETQAKIFLDINEKQKAIKSDLRWDLYEDIYLEATYQREQELYAISVIAKSLNKKPPFSRNIKIPSEGNVGHISLTTLCRVIRSQKLISNQNAPLYRDEILKSIQFAEERIALFFQILADEMPTEWRAGEKHYINTNAGVVVFLGILRDILELLRPAQINDLDEFRFNIGLFLEPIIRHLRQSPDAIGRYRRAGGATGASRQVQATLTKFIVNANVGFSSHFLVEYEEEQKAQELARQQLHEEEQLALLIAGENDMLEVKGSLSLDVNRLLLGDGVKDKSKDVDNEILSTIVGFLNGRQRETRLAIGAIETKRYGYEKIEQKLGFCPQIGSFTVIGIENGYGFVDADQFETRLRDIVKSRITPYIESSLTIEFLPFKGKNLSVIKMIRDPNQWCYLDDKHFYVRQGNRTVELSGRDADDYKERWRGKTV